MGKREDIKKKLLADEKTLQSGMQGFLKGFQQFILRGNVVDLAVGVMIGASFNSVVTALVKDMLTPLVAAIFSQPNFSTMVFTLHGSQLLYGDFINAIISFLITAVAIYFFVVVPVNTLIHRMRRQPPPDPTTKKCPECFSEIAVQATRCAFCTIDLKNLTPQSQPAQAQ